MAAKLSKDFSRFLWNPVTAFRFYQIPNRASLHACNIFHQYREVSKPYDTKEIELLTKSTTPAPLESVNKVVVNEETETLKLKPVNSFYTNSVFYDALVSKFVNCMMHGGKKSASQTVLNDTFERIKKIQLEKQRKLDDKSDIETDPLQIFHIAIENAKPVIGTQTMKKKGKNFQVPYPLPDNRRRFLAIKWFLTTARNRPGNSVPFSIKLSKELLDAYQNQGAVVQKKVDYHKKAEVNRAFAHYRWW